MDSYTAAIVNFEVNGGRARSIQGRRTQRLISLKPRSVIITPPPLPHPACLLLWDAGPVHPPDAALRIIHNMPPSGWTKNPLHKTPESAAAGGLGNMATFFKPLPAPKKAGRPPKAPSNAGRPAAAAPEPAKGLQPPTAAEGPVACC